MISSNEIPLHCRINYLIKWVSVGYKIFRSLYQCSGLKVGVQSNMPIVRTYTMYTCIYYLRTLRKLNGWVHNLRQFPGACYSFKMWLFFKYIFIIIILCFQLGKCILKIMSMLPYMLYHYEKGWNAAQSFCSVTNEGIAKLKAGSRCLYSAIQTLQAMKEKVDHKISTTRHFWQPWKEYERLKTRNLTNDFKVGRSTIISRLKTKQMESSNGSMMNILRI